MNQENATNGFNPQQPQQQKVKEISDLREVIESYLIYWKWIVAAMVVALVAGGIYVMTQPSIYEFKASVLIIDPKNQMNELSILSELKQMGFNTNTKLATNEEKVLKSTHLMKRVVSELDLHTTYLRKVSLHKEDMYTDSPFKVTLDSGMYLNLKSRLNLTIHKKNGGYQVVGKYGDEHFSELVHEFPVTLTSPAGPVTITRIPESPYAGHTTYVTIDNPTNTALILANSGVKSEIDKNADEIRLTYRANNIQRGQDVLTTLVQLYNRDAVEQITQSAAFTSVFIKNRLDLLTSELSSVEQKIEDYKQTNEMTNIETDAELFMSNNIRFTENYLEAEIQLQLIEYMEQFVKNPKNRNQLIPDLGLGDRGLMNVINEFNMLLLSRKKIEEGTSENNPVLITLNKQIDEAHRAILVGITNSKRGFQLSARKLEDQNQQFKNKLRAIPRQEREFVEIKRQQQVKEALYVFLLQKGEEAQMSMAIATNKARLLNEPDEAKKVAPRTLVVFTVFLLLGFIIPVSIIFFKNLLNTTIRNRVDIERITKLPVLLELSHNKSAEPVFDHRSNEIANAELFRLLRAKLQFVLSGNNDKVILVTSTQPGEGKTFVSVNLAITLSLLDKKVVLVGLDLRKPMLSKVLNLSSKEGVTSYLAGQVNDYHQLVEKPEQYPNLHVLPAGIIPPNPNELIISDRFDTLFSRLRDEYDYIVLDTSPVGAVSDTYLIDRVADMCLFVCRSEYSDTRNIEFVNRLDAEGSLRRIYLVVNDVDFESHKYAYYRRYGYGYGYAYGYTYGNSSANKKK